jgi:CHAP domain
MLTHPAITQALASERRRDLIAQARVGYMFRMIRRATKGCLVAAGSIAVLAFCMITLPLSGIASAAPAPGYGTGSGFCKSISSSAYNLGANYDNVYACGPSQGLGDVFDPYPNAFQCVELAERFEWAIYGGPEVYNTSGKAYVQDLHNAQGVPIASSGSGSLPAPGDVISMWGPSGTEPSGHVAVVTAVNAPGGTGTITIMEQNGTTTGWDSIKVSGETLTYGNPRSYYYYNSFHWTIHGGGSSNGYEVAFQANTGNLYTFSSASGPGNLSQGMKAGTSPSITALAGGGYEEAFQANTGNLIVYGSGGNINTGQGMMPGTSPSISARP